MDKTAAAQAGQSTMAREQAQCFVQAVGDVLHAPQALGLSADGICGFTLSSGSTVVFIYDESKLVLLCQLSIEMAEQIDHFNCYQEMLQRSFHTNPDKDGVVCVSPDGDQLLVHWRLLVSQRLPHSEVFVDYLLQANHHWSRFMHERSRQ